jgi:serine protease Do
MAALVAGLLVASGAVDVRVEWRGKTARALDPAKGDGEAKPPVVAARGEPFWHESQTPAEAPAGPQNHALSSFADLAERASPAVVNIKTSKKIEGPEGRHPLEEFFGGPFGPFGRKVPSLGTGFVISSDGYIVTNNHVVEGVDTIKVALLDGTELDAKTIGRDPKTDIALIKVEPKSELPALPLGNSDAVRPGDWVVAIGNPYGYAHSVTAGIVSAKGRSLDQGPYDDFIQTDAAINPGNSGGPLINLSGEVIGINTAINPQANTMGFAVPINLAKDILPQLRASGKVVRGWLGVMIQKVSADLAKEFELDERAGALVAKVDPRGPAQKAGIKSGDVIVRFAGQDIKEMEQLPRAVAATPPGQKVEVVVIREGDRKKFEIELGTLPDEEVAESGEPGEPEEGTAAFGLQVQELTPEIAEQLGLEQETGVVIAGVVPGSPAEEAGLRRRDVILEVDHESVTSVADLRKRLNASGESALLLVQRGNSALFVPLKKSAD